MKLLANDWFRMWDDIYIEVRNSKMWDVGDYLQCDIIWTNSEPDANNRIQLNKYVRLKFWNPEDELFFKLKWEVKECVN